MTRRLRVPAACLFVLCLATAAVAELEPVGTEYWFAWPETADVTGDDSNYDLDGELLVLTDSTVPVPVSVAAPGLAWSGQIQAGSPARIRVPRALMLAGDGGVETKGIRVFSENCGSFSALFRVPGSGSSVGDDAMTLLPTTNLGTLHYPDTYHGQAEFAVLAVEDNTTVTWDNPFCPGLTTVVLDRGEAVQHECHDDGANAVARGITGTRVESDRPVAVFAASAASNIIDYYFQQPGPMRVYWCCADILMEQMRPLSDWEHEYRTVPGVATGPRWSGDLVRIVAGCDGTGVTVDDGLEIRSRTLDAGESWDLVDVDLINQEFGLSPDPLVIRSDQPVEVSQYMVGFMHAGVGDPAQLLVPGLTRPAGNHPFLLLEGYDNYLTIVATASAAAQVFLDGGPVDPADWNLYPDGAWVWARIGGLSPGSHVLTSPAPLAAAVLGYSTRSNGDPTAGAIAYPVPGGGVDDPFPSLITSEDACGLHCPGDCITLDGGGAYTSWEWSTGETTRLITVCPTEAATYTVRVFDENGCEGMGRIHVPVLPAPEPQITGETTVCEGGCTDLSAGPGWASVLWSTGETTETIAYCPGDPLSTLSVEATDAEGCAGEASVEIEMLLYPDFGAASAGDAGPCDLGILVEWDEAVWHSDPPAGTYAVHRSTTDCADALAGPALAGGLAGTSWLDTATVPGGTYVYAVVAEDSATGAPCTPPGEGLKTTVCIDTPVTDTLDRTPPDPGAGKSLRGGGHDVARVRFTWNSAPAPDPAQAEHFHLYRSDSYLGPFLPVTPEGLTDREFTDDGSPGTRLLFYDLRMADRCENADGDPYPATPMAPPICHTPHLTEGLPHHWDTFDPPCRSLVDTHTCAPGDWSGNDRGHRLETTSSGPFSARFRDGGDRLDLFLYDEAMSGCIAWGDEEIVLPDLPAGRYLLVVDGPGGSEGPYGIVWAATP